jgi:hypothetical protein
MIIRFCPKGDPLRRGLFLKESDQILKEILKRGYLQVKLKRSREGQKLFDDFVDSSDLFEDQIREGEILFLFRFFRREKFPPEPLESHAHGIEGIANLMGDPRG